MTAEQRNLAARRYAPQIGLELTQQFPERIPELYRAMNTMEQIIYLLAIQDLYPHAAPKTLINAISYALRGYDGQDLAAEHIKYAGLMSSEEVALIHRKLILARGAQIAGMRWIGKEQHWSEEEIQYLIDLTKVPKYMYTSKRKNSGADYAGIAKEVNDKFHNGKPTRTLQSVRNMIRRNKKFTS